MGRPQLLELPLKMLEMIADYLALGDVQSIRVTAVAITAILLQFLAARCPPKRRCGIRCKQQWVRSGIEHLQWQRLPLELLKTVRELALRTVVPWTPLSAPFWNTVSIMKQCVQKSSTAPALPLLPQGCSVLHGVVRHDRVHEHLHRAHLMSLVSG